MAGATLALHLLFKRIVRLRKCRWIPPTVVFGGDWGSIFLVLLLAKLKSCRQYRPLDGASHVVGVGHSDGPVQQ